MRDWFKLLSIIIIFSLGTIVYSDSFFSSFHYDDRNYILYNTSIRNIADLQSIWQFCPCRFITFLSIALNFHFHGFDLFGFHLFNLAVHLICAVLVWWLVLLTLSTPVMKGERISAHAGLIALLAGLVFVTHPLQTEAVTYIWQRASSIAALFYLASLCFYVKSRSSRGSAFYYISSLMTAILAMFTKENAITLPLMVLLYELYFLKTEGGLNWKRLLPFLLTVLIIPATMLLTKSARFQEIHDVTTGPGSISPLHYFLTQSRVMVTYIRLLFLPLHQNLDYDYPVFKNILEWPVLAGFLFLAAVIFWAKSLFSKYRIVSFSIFWFFLALLPESSFLPLEDVIFEHRLYLPLAGYSIFLASGLYYLLGRNSIKMMVVVLSTVIACNSVLAYQRNKVWKNELTLCDDIIRKSPGKARPYEQRGMVYVFRGQFSQAISDFTKAIEIKPHDPESYIDRGNAYNMQGDLPAAISDYNKAINIKPDDAGAYTDLGIAYGKQGDLTRAISEFNKALEINPNFTEAYKERALGYALLKKQ